MSPSSPPDRSVPSVPPERDARVLSALEAYQAELERGAPARPEEMLARHPDLAEPLKAYLPALELLYRTARGMQDGLPPRPPPRPRSWANSATSASCARSAGAAWAWSTKPSRSRCGGGWR